MVKKKQQKISAELVKCPKCNFEFKKESLRAHILVMHEIGLLKECDVSGNIKVYACTDCAPYTVWSTQQALDDHQADKH